MSENNPEETPENPQYQTVKALYTNPIPTTSLPGSSYVAVTFSRLDSSPDTATQTGEDFDVASFARAVRIFCAFSTEFLISGHLVARANQMPTTGKINVNNCYVSCLKSSPDFLRRTVETEVILPNGEVDHLVEAIPESVFNNTCVAFLCVVGDYFLNELQDAGIAMTVGTDTSINYIRKPLEEVVGKTSMRVVGMIPVSYGSLYQAQPVKIPDFSMRIYDRLLVFYQYTANPGVLVTMRNAGYDVSYNDAYVVTHLSMTCQLSYTNN